MKYTINNITGEYGYRDSNGLFCKMNEFHISKRYKEQKEDIYKPKNFFQKSQNQSKKGIPPPKNFF